MTKSKVPRPKAGDRNTFVVGGDRASFTTYRNASYDRRLNGSGFIDELTLRIDESDDDKHYYFHSRTDETQRRLVVGEVVVMECIKYLRGTQQYWPSSYWKEVKENENV